MTIDEAAKILTDYVGTGPEVEPVEFDKAVALGAEVLKREQRRRKYDIHLPIELLPGETKS